MRSRSLRASTRSILATLGLALVVGPAPAREVDGRSPFTCREWQVDDGLVGSHIEAMTRSTDGYLWLGSYNDGPVRFDGVAFTRLWSISPGYAAIFKRDDSTTVLLGASDGGLWIGSRFGGLVRIHGDSTVSAFATAQGLPHDSVLSIREAADGSAWVGTEAGLCRVRGGVVERFDEPGGPGRVPVSALWDDPDGTFWVATKGWGLFRKCQGHWTNFNKQTVEGLWTDTILSLRRDRGGRLWVGTENGLHRLEDGRFRHFSQAEGLPNPVVRSLGEDRQGNLWVGTIRGACVLREDDTFATILSGQGAALRFVFSLLCDREGGTWAATSAGLYRFRPREIATVGTEDGLSDPLVTTVCPAREGGLWIATGAGLNRMGPDGVIRPVKHPTGLSIDGLTALHEDEEGALWVGTWGSGLFRIGVDGSRKYNVADGLGGGVIRSVLRARDGTVWVGTWGGGLGRIVDGKVTHLTVRDGLGHDRVRGLLEDHLGRIWVGTVAGLSRIEGGRIVKTYTPSDGLSNDSIFSMHEDARGVLWIGTSGGGLIKFEDGRFLALTTRNGLFADTITRILEDRSGDLWLGSQRGIFRVQKAQVRDYEAGRLDVLTCLTYGRNEGMRSGQCSGGSQPAGCVDSEGQLWFPTLDGLAVVDPSRAAANDIPPPTMIEEVLIDGLPSLHQSPRGPGRGELEFRYSACTFGDPAKVRFRYRLEGFDPGWTYAGDRRVAFYTNVPPGHYRFQVRACNDDGLWDEAGVSTPIDLPPHFYQTGAFSLFAAGFLLLLLKIGYRTRMKAAQSREDELVRIVADRTVELESAKAELLSHNQRLSELAATDALTGLWNRRRFVESLGSALASAASRGRPTSVLMLDVDHFKSYNDSFGHPAGDEALQAVAAILRASGRESDVVARHGGEEFIVLLPNTTAPDAVRVADRLRDRIESAEWPHRPVTASFGVATGDDASIDASTLVSQADLALYRAKSAGRNRVAHAQCVGLEVPPEPSRSTWVPEWNAEVAGPHDRRSSGMAGRDRRRKSTDPPAPVLSTE